MSINYYDLITERQGLFNDFRNALLLVAGRYYQADPTSGIN